MRESIINSAACVKEGPEAGRGGSAYILPGGEYYHTRADCSSLSYYVREVPLSEVKGLGPCSYCGGGKIVRSVYSNRSKAV